MIFQIKYSQISFMDVKQVKIFLKVAELMHFSRAAEYFCMAQSALSRQIMALEAEIGCPLFRRENRWHIALTAAGRSFRADAEKFVMQAEDMAHRALMAERGDIGRLSICAIPSFLREERFIEAIKAMRRSHPNVSLEILESSSEGVMSKVVSGDADFGIVRIVNPHLEGIKSITLGRDKILLAMSEDNPLSRRPKLRMEDLRDCPFVMIPRSESPFFRQLIESTCAEVGGFIPKVMREVYNFELILRLMPGSLDVSFVPALYNTDSISGVVFREVEGVGLYNSYSGLWRSENDSPTLVNFVKILSRRKNFK